MDLYVYVSTCVICLLVRCVDGYESDSTDSMVTDINGYGWLRICIHGYGFVYHPAFPATG